MHQMAFFGYRIPEQKNLFYFQGSKLFKKNKNCPGSNPGAVSDSTLPSHNMLLHEQ